MRKPNHICYIGRTRLHRSQANLIQTLQTIAGWRRLGCDVDLYLPPWPRRLDTEQHLQSMGVAHPPRLIRCPLLHPRFRFDPWVRLHAGTLRSYPIVYTRVVDISLALARAKIPHHLEIHDTRQVLDHHQIERVIAHHQTGLIQFLLPISQNAASTLLHYGAVSETPARRPVRLSISRPSVRSHHGPPIACSDHISSTWGASAKQQDRQYSAPSRNKPIAG
ncbi:MAG: hypothetical protein ACOX52_17185 [Verrucomicrobiota bacterium]